MTHINTTTDAQTSLNVTVEVCAGKYEDYPFPVDTGEPTEFVQKNKQQECKRQIIKSTTYGNCHLVMLKNLA